MRSDNKPPRPIKDQKLRDMMTYGVAFHHAGLDNHDRQLIEQMFLGGQIMMIASTSVCIVEGYVC